MQRKVESRRYPRYRTNANAIVHLPGTAEPEPAGLLEEIGLGGCRIRTTTNFGVGRVLSLSLNIGQDPIRAIAKVLYEKDSLGPYVDTGLAFVSMDEGELERLRNSLPPR